MRVWQVISLLAMLIVTTAHAQDAHYSQFYRDPIYTNPANAGSFLGSYRFEGHYRNQWNSVTQPFETYGLSVDAANFLKLKGLGTAINIFNDVSGDGSLSNLQINLALSYGLRLTSDSTQILTFGIQGGWYHRQIDFNSLFFDDQYTNGSYKPDLATSETYTSNSNNDFNTHAGIIYNNYLSSRSRITAGLAIHNITSPNLAFTGDDEPLDLRYSLHAQVEFPIHANLNLLPGVLGMSQGPHREVLAGANLKYLLDQRLYNYRAFQLGGWCRWDDAVVVFAGVDWGPWQFGASYDINTSSLQRASGNRGGFELSVIYILKDILPKRINFKNCPDYI